MGYRNRDVDRWYHVLICWYWNHKPDQKIRPEGSKMKCANCTANLQTCSQQPTPCNAGQTSLVRTYLNRTYVRRNSKYLCCARSSREVKLIKSSIRGFFVGALLSSLPFTLQYELGTILPR